MDQHLIQISYVLYILVYQLTVKSTSEISNQLLIITGNSIYRIELNSE